MQFVVVTHAPIAFHEGKVYTYAPYGREMNLWFKHVDKILLVCPEEPYDGKGLLAPLEISAPFRHMSIPDFNLLNWPSRFKALPAIMVCLIQIFRGMWLANHIHLRVPGNIGLLGCFVQIFFPFKKKTAKYAGNWDWQSRQPFTYRLQQGILRSTVLTHNIKVLIYGNWPDVNRNLLPFFTATYRNSDIEPTSDRLLTPPLKLIFVGTMVEGKQPLFSVKVVQQLNESGIDAIIHMFGNGPLMGDVQHYVAINKLQDYVILHGNKAATEVKEYFKSCHFLVFISKSEGWPKVVAESLFWGCVPITTRVSCVPEMLGNGKRGTLVEPSVPAVVEAIKHWTQVPNEYKKASLDGMQWSRQFTLEKFEQEIVRLL